MSPRNVSLHSYMQSNNVRRCTCMLLLDDDSCIEDEDDILEEVSRFYGELFKLVGDNLEVLEAY